MQNAVVRAAREEVRTASWKRPTSGPGARSKSADTRLRLEPLQQRQPRAAAKPPPPEAWPAAAQPSLTRSSDGGATKVGGVITTTGPLLPPRRREQRPFGSPAFAAPVVPSQSSTSRSPSLNAAQFRVAQQPAAEEAASALVAQADATSASLSATRRQPLLRPRPRVSRSPSSAEGHSGGEGSAFFGDGPEWSGSDGAEDNHEDARGQRYRSPSSERSIGDGGSARSHRSQASRAASSSSDAEVEAELAEVEAELATKGDLLRDLEVKQKKLEERVDSSVRHANELLATVGRLEARIVDVAHEATAAHRTPRARRGAGSSHAADGGGGTKKVSVIARLEELVGQWTSAPLCFTEAPSAPATSAVVERPASDAAPNVGGQPAADAPAARAKPSMPSHDDSIDDEKRQRFLLAMGMA